MVAVAEEGPVLPRYSLDRVWHAIAVGFAPEIRDVGPQGWLVDEHLAELDLVDGHGGNRGWDHRGGPIPGHDGSEDVVLDRVGGCVVADPG